MYKCPDKNAPIEFKLGDIVSFGGVEGVVAKMLPDPAYKVRVDFPCKENVGFTIEGKYILWHTESLLKLVRRPEPEKPKPTEPKLKAWIDGYGRIYAVPAGEVNEDWTRAEWLDQPEESE